MAIATTCIGSYPKPDYVPISDWFDIDKGLTTAGAMQINTDTGEIKRHRGFYIIDRSVPVAFEPGQNHNVDQAVLLRRFIE